MTDQQLEEFRARLLTHRRRLAGDVESISSQALNNPNGSHLPIHLADNGSDTFEQDLSLGFVDSECEEIREIDDALDKIKEGCYGTCEECEQQIPLPRLEAIPFARYCVSCKQMLEEES